MLEGPFILFPLKDSVKEVIPSPALQINCLSLQHIFTSLTLKQESDSKLDFLVLKQLEIKNYQSLTSLFTFNLDYSNQSNERQESLNEKSRLRVLQSLTDQKHFLLIEKLKKQSSNELWQIFEQIKHPLLIEQFIDLFALCQFKQLQNNRMISFALQCAQLIDEKEPDKTLQSVTQVIGELIYLVDKKPDTLLEAFQTIDEREVLQVIKHQFNLAMFEIHDQLKALFVQHLQTGLQSAEIALHYAIPIHVASILLTTTGTINVGLIDLIIPTFSIETSQKINHATQLIYTLKILQRSFKLRSTFENLRAPSTALSMINHLIRACLKLSLQETVTNSHTRQVLLAALLSHLRQGKGSSCFAVSLAIEMLASHLNFCLKDLCQLLIEGKLTRQVNNVYKDVPFMPHISDENLNQNITFDNEGTLFIDHQPRGKLWEAPGLNAACQAIGLGDCQAYLKHLIHVKHKEAPQSLYTQDIRTFLTQLSDYAALHSSLSQQTLYHQACFAFSSQTCHPLLKIWENAIGNMAEIEEESLIKTKIIKSLFETLQYHLSQRKIPTSRLLQNFLLLLQKKLYDHVQLEYDPTVQNQLTKEGGFVLYNLAERVDSPITFRHFIHQLLLETREQFMPLTLASVQEREIDELNKIFSILTTAIQTDDFMIFLLTRYHPLKLTSIVSLDSKKSIAYHKLLFTPWITQTGNNSKAVLKIYLEYSQAIDSDLFISKNAYQTLTHIIKICQQMTETEKNQYLSHPGKLRPLCIVGKHRCSFIAGHPSLIQAWQHKEVDPEWIETHVLKSGQEVSESIISKTMHQQLIQHLQDEYFPRLTKKDATLFSTERTNKLLKSIQKIPLSLTIQAYRQQILSKTRQIFSLSKKMSQSLMHQIDIALYHSLDPDLKQKLEKSAVHFADTNWHQELQDIYFCFVVNPGTGELELWQSYADGQLYKALNQTYWLKHQQWEFFKFPPDLIVDD